jgi:hypothetical protein
MQSDPPRFAFQFAVGIAPPSNPRHPDPPRVATPSPGCGLAASRLGPGLVNLSPTPADAQATEAVDRMLEGPKAVLDRLTPPPKAAPFSVPVLSRGVKRPRRAEPAALRARVAGRGHR